MDGKHTTSSQCTMYGPKRFVFKLNTLCAHASGTRTSHSHMRMQNLGQRRRAMRFTSHQDVTVFKGLVDSVARTLTHYVLYPLVITGSSSYLTSDKIVYAGTVESEQRETFVWFPLSPTTGLCLVSDGHTGQILGPRVEVDRLSGRIRFAKLPESPILRCQAPSPQEVTANFVNTMNGLIVQGSTQLYSATRAAMDSALKNAEQPTGYRYYQSEEIADPTNTV